MLILKKPQSVCRTFFLFIFCCVSCFSNLALAAGSVTQYQYDARGRLTQVKDNANREVNYSYDAAGNRINVNDGAVVPIVDPVITQFTAPRRVTTSGATALISWASTGASYCALAIFGDYSSYPNMPTTSSQSIRVYEDTAVTITCYEGTKSASAGKTIRLINRN